MQLLSSLRAGLGGELRAVAPKAQRKVKPPNGLDLNTELYTPTAADWAVLGTSTGGDAESKFGGSGGGGGDGEGGGYGRHGGSNGGGGGGGGSSPTVERTPRPQPSGPYYLPSEPKSASSAAVAASALEQQLGEVLRERVWWDGGGASSRRFAADCGRCRDRRRAAGWV